MDKNQENKTISDYPKDTDLEVNKNDTTNEKALQQEKRLAADLDDKQPAGDTGPEDGIKEGKPEEIPPY